MTLEMVKIVKATMLRARLGFVCSWVVEMFVVMWWYWFIA